MLQMEERNQEARQLYMDGRHTRARDRQMLREAVSHRLQAYFIGLREAFPEDANTLLQRAELQTTPRTLESFGGMA